jgi:hypothetical protein
MNTESGRVSNILSNARCSMAAAALAKARLMTPTRYCGPCGSENKNIPSVNLPSMTLSAQATNCVSYQAAASGVPSSVRTAQIEERTIYLSFDPSDPVTRFSEFRRPFIEVCPPIPQWYYTAGEPVLQGKNCPLPNKPDNPVLPG